VNQKDTVELIPGWRNKVHACPGTIDVMGTVEVHGVVLGVINRDRSLHIRPLSDETSECLRFDHLAWSKIDGIGVEFDHPFNDVAIGFLVLEDIAEWVLINHCYGKHLKVMMELLGHDQDGV
jgi:hypothetical protein